MSEQEKKRDPKSLVGSILAKTKQAAPTLPDDSPLAQEAQAVGLERMVAQMAAAEEASDAAPAEAPAAAAPKTPEDAAREAAELIEVYFELEEPIERDAAFDRIVSVDAPIVTEFLRAVMEEDEDEYVRSAAAVELAKRGNPEAIALLEADLADPEEPFFFTQALQALSAVRGAAFYDTLLAIWQDPKRDAEQRREAMLGLESVDASRALGDFVSFVESQTDIETMLDDQVEIAMLAFIRHDYKDGQAALARLKERILAATNIDPEERDELAAFVQEGIDLLS